ncbi:hypothetical protein ACG2F4_15005 [Halalkalibaculum sp. DA3122]|uniref:hypothetical protein n=1 Tax=unclassified Halalkalibaculum TaxID=2964617 RepID=UPI003754A16A
MKKSLHILYDEYRSKEIMRFLDILRIRKCSYYASDLLQVEDDKAKIVENSVQRTIEIFKTLNLPIGDHFYRIYRGNPDYIYKDWKLSELACIYMMMNGDPTDLSNLARQQTNLIDQMLQYMHPYQIAHKE